MYALPRSNLGSSAAWGVDAPQGRSKYERRVNFSDAVYPCRQALRGWFLGVLSLRNGNSCPAGHSAAIPVLLLLGSAFLPAMSPLADSSSASPLFADLWQLNGIGPSDGRTPDPIRSMSPNAIGTLRKGVSQWSGRELLDTLNGYPIVVLMRGALALGYFSSFQAGAHSVREGAL